MLTTIRMSLPLICLAFIHCQSNTKQEQLLSPGLNANTDTQLQVEQKEVSEPKKPLRTVEPLAIETLKDSGIYDPSNSALAVLQDPTVAMKDFPVDRRMQVDWVKTINQGLIKPRANLQGTETMLVMDLDIIMKKTKNMPYVRFPHRQHTQWLECTNCHPKIFIPKVNANPITMNKVLRGEYCGVCHDKVAFSLFICERCHSVPHAGSGKWW